jgi:hypothetical protein
MYGVQGSARIRRVILDERSPSLYKLELLLALFEAWTLLSPERFSVLVRLNEKGHVRFASARVCVSAEGERTGTGGSLVYSVRPSSLRDSLLFFNPSSLLSFPQISLSVCGV